MKVIFLCWNIEPLIVTNVTCGIFQSAVCIIGLVGKHLGLTFSVYWLEPFLSPPAAWVRPRNAKGGHDMTFHSWVGISEERMRTTTCGGRMSPSAHFSQQKKVSGRHLQNSVGTSCETRSGWLLVLLRFPNLKVLWPTILFLLAEINRGLESNVGKILYIF